MGFISNQLNTVFINAEMFGGVFFFLSLAQKKIPTNANSFWPPKNFVIDAACFLSPVGFESWPHGIFKLAEEYLLVRALGFCLIEYSRLTKVPVFLKNKNQNALWT